MKNTKKRGFTIVELVIVIAVIAILASVLIPTFANVVTKARESKELQEARNAYTQALVDHATETGACDQVVGDWKVTFDGNGVPTVTKGSGESAITYTFVNGEFKKTAPAAGGSGNQGAVGGNQGGNPGSGGENAGGNETP